MSKKNKNEAKSLKSQVADVPNPPVPNRAHTEMKADSKNEAKNQGQNKNEQNCK